MATVIRTVVQEAHPDDPTGKTLCVLDILELSMSGDADKDRRELRKWMDQCVDQLLRKNGAVRFVVEREDRA